MEVRVFGMDWTEIGIVIWLFKLVGCWLVDTGGATVRAISVCFFCFMIECYWFPPTASRLSSGVLVNGS